MRHTDSTIEWYVGWLGERNPEWTDEQRLEVATGFAKQQEPQSLQVIEDDALVADKTAAELRTAERKARRHLTADELSALLSDRID